MHIVGGFYRELCDIPFWDATMGSGARAALAAAELASDTEFTTYASSAEHVAIASLQRRGIATTITARPTPIVFAYFHPLSSPHIEPPREALTHRPFLRVTGDAVLRFGFLEGDAVVAARRAVYDPQTWRNPQPFAANGSTAEELALVMNELEIQKATGIEHIDQAAHHLIQTQGAQIVVVKQGPYGATVYDTDGGCFHIPAYRSAHVFKIGTGDIFSAVFAHYWAQMRIPAPEAADLASRAVSVYCETRTFQFDQAALTGRQPVFATRRSTVRLEAGIEAVGQRYVLEEARFALNELEVNVVCPNIEQAAGIERYDATLVINDALPAESIARITQDIAQGTDVVVLKERSGTSTPWSTTSLTTPDFTTAIYFAAWAAGESVSRNRP